MGKSNYTVMRCVLVGCSHYIRKDLARDKVSLCNRCNQPFVMDARAIRMEKPCCIDCVDRRDKQEVNKLKELFGG